MPSAEKPPVPSGVHDEIYYYHNSDGERIGAVCKDEKGKLVALKYDGDSWDKSDEWNVNPPYIPIKAQRKDNPAGKPVVIVGTEQQALSLAKILIEVMGRKDCPIILSWRGGSRRQSGTYPPLLTDWDILNGRDVIYWPDNANRSAVNAMDALADYVKSIVKGYRTIRNDDGGKHNILKIIDRKHGAIAAKLVKQLFGDIRTGAERDAEAEEAANIDWEQWAADNEYYTYLGWTKEDELAFYVKWANRIRVFKERAFGEEMTLLALTKSILPWQLGADQERAKTREKLSVTSWAKRLVMSVSDKKGVWSSKNRRALGCHKTATGDIVINFGDCLYVNDERAKTYSGVEYFEPFVAMDSSHMEQCEEGLEYWLRFFSLYKRYRWSVSVEKIKTGNNLIERQIKTGHIVFVGWIISGLLGGALVRRPHLFMTGDSRSGKSYALGHMKMILSDAADNVSSKPSAASIRRMTRDSAKPFLWDEAQVPRNLSAQGYMDEIDLILRTASDMTNASTKAKGGTDNEIITEMPRCQFLLSAVNLPQMMAQLASRVIHLTLSQYKSMPDEDFDKFSDELHEMLTPQNCAKMRCWVWRNAHFILKSIDEAIQQTATIEGINARDRQIFGVLYGAARAIEKAAPTADNAVISGNDLEDMYKQYRPQLKSERVLIKEEMLAHEFTYTGIESGQKKTTVSSAIGDIINEDKSTDLVALHRTLAEKGIKVLRSNAEAGKHDVLFAVRLPSLAKTLNRSANQLSDIKTALLGIPGAWPDYNNQAFANVYTPYTVRVPVDSLFGTEDDKGDDAEIDYSATTEDQPDE